ncbi:MAG: YqiA/YcfP family alpha/beta fold hydrolase [Acidobacteriota bacterium]
MHVFYLHGFASSAQSKKAAYFGERFRSHGVVLHCPDFNEPDFATLTLTRMLDQLGRDIAALEPAPVVLLGSSLGAVVALHTAARWPGRVTRLVLLAPALLFGKDGHKFLGPERVADWRTRGVLDVSHFGYGETRLLNYAFYEDSLRYDAFAADVTQPTLILQGLRDESVDHRVVEQYAATRSRVALKLFDDDHQLMASLPVMWDEIAEFLDLT